MIKTFRFALLACGLVGGALTATAAPAVPVRVATVELAPHAEERAIPGRVEAIRAVDIRARTEGVIVQRHFQDGQYVTEGDLLFTLDDAQPRAALALAQAELKSAEASLRQSQQLLTRYERLINNHPSAATTSIRPGCSATSPPLPYSRPKPASRPSRLCSATPGLRRR